MSCAKDGCRLSKRAQALAADVSQLIASLAKEPCWHGDVLLARADLGAQLTWRTFLLALTALSFVSAEAAWLTPRAEAGSRKPSSALKFADDFLLPVRWTRTRGVLRKKRFQINR